MWRPDFRRAPLRMGGEILPKPFESLRERGDTAKAAETNPMNPFPPCRL